MNGAWVNARMAGVVESFFWGGWGSVIAPHGVGFQSGLVSVVYEVQGWVSLHYHVQIRRGTGGCVKKQHNDLVSSICCIRNIYAGVIVLKVQCCNSKDPCYSAMGGFSRMRLSPIFLLSRSCIGNLYKSVFDLSEYMIQKLILWCIPWTRINNAILGYFEVFFFLFFNPFPWFYNPHYISTLGAYLALVGLSG